MVNVGALTAEICWWVWGTPANFNRLRVLPSLLHRRGSTEVNQTLHYVWPTPGLIHYIYILPDAKLTLRPSLAFSYIGSVTARYSISWRQANFATFSRGRHRYSAGRPSRWASSHILVSVFIHLPHFLELGFYCTYAVLPKAKLCDCILCMHIAQWAYLIVLFDDEQRMEGWLIQISPERLRKDLGILS